MNYKCIFVDWYRTLSMSVFWEQLKDDYHPYHHLYKPISTFLFVESQDLIQHWMRGHLKCEKVVEHLCRELRLDSEIMLSTCEKCTKNSKVKVHHLDVTQPRTSRRRRGALCLSADNWHLSN